MESSHRGKKGKNHLSIHGASKLIINSLERYFYWHGKTVSKRPYLSIFLSLLAAGLCGIGLINFTTEERPFKLWISQESDFVNVFNWQNENFPTKLRPQFVVFEAENVLDKAILLEIMKVHDIVVNTYTPNITFKEICYRIPKLGNLPTRRRKRFNTMKPRSKRQLAWLDYVFRSGYCQLAESLETECFEQSILEVWGNDATILESRSQQEIYDDIKAATVSLVFGTPMNVSNYLSTVTYDDNERIIGAKAARHTWGTKIDYEAMANGDNYVDDSGIGMAVDKNGFEWEGQYLQNLLNHSSKLQNPKIFIFALSSFGRVGGSAIYDDAVFLALGFSVVYLYVLITLGKCNCIDQRPILSLFGISCIGLAILVSHGLCSAFSVPFGPVNNVLPFLLLGLGVDDMFVIMQSWNTLSPQEKTRSLSTRMGLALKHAGVSITITSVTDFMAFAIGSTTALPALRSFCLYAATGIISVYAFQATFFVAWLALDQRRLENKRNGVLWCIKMDGWQTNECSHKDLCQMFFENIFTKLLHFKAAKILVILTTLGLFGTSCWGLSNLRQEFNPMWFLPEKSYIYKYHAKMKQYFPATGYDGVVYLARMNLFHELPKILSLVEELKSIEYVSSVDSWAESYALYLRNLGYDLYDESVDEEQFYRELGQFLYSPEGAIYKTRNFVFDGNFTCLDPLPKVSASSIDFRYKVLFNSYERISAMDEVRDVIRRMNFSGYVKPWSRIYSSWETDKIIEAELYRNLGMAMGVVFLLTLILIASFTTSFMVLTCVAFTMVDVGALMHWWGLTIDTVSCIDLILAIGLCVDYAAHIGHTFMTQNGTRDQRMQSTLTKIGPAVLNGGFSTFLSFVFLANSNSHVFKTFFKIFFSVSLFGMYHGLVFLPVLLSIIGPKPYEQTAKGDIPEILSLQPDGRSSSGGNGLSSCSKQNYMHYETSL